MFVILVKWYEKVVSSSKDIFWAAVWTADNDGLFLKESSYPTCPNGPDNPLNLLRPGLHYFLNKKFLTKTLMTYFSQNIYVEIDLCSHFGYPEPTSFFLSGHFLDRLPYPLSPITFGFKPCSSTSTLLWKFHDVDYKLINLAICFFFLPS